MIFTRPCLRVSRRSPGAPSIDGTQSRDRGRLLLACSTLARFARHPCRSPRVVPFLSIGADHLTGCRGLSLAKGASIDFCNQLPFTSTRNPSDSRASRRSPLRDPARLSPRWCRAPFSARLRVTTSVDAAPRASIRQAGPLPRSSFLDPPPRRFRPRAESPSNLWHSRLRTEHRFRPPIRWDPSFLPRVNATGVTSPRAPSTLERPPRRRSDLTIRDVTRSPAEGRYVVDACLRSAARAVTARPARDRLSSARARAGHPSKASAIEMDSEHVPGGSPIPDHPPRGLPLGRLETTRALPRLVASPGGTALRAIHASGGCQSNLWGTGKDVQRRPRAPS